MKLSRLATTLGMGVAMFIGTTINPHVTAGAALPRQTSALPLAIHVQGNQFVNQNGQTIRLLGVNRDGSEFRCVLPGSQGVFAGPTDPTNIVGVDTWHVNAVRLPLNEDCWLGINGVDANLAGATYQAAIHAQVAALNQRGIYAILDLHDSAPGTLRAQWMQGAPDEDHSPAFWSSVASSFRNQPAVVFDLFNEPTLDMTTARGTDAWACLLNGCTDNSYFPDSRMADRQTLNWQTAGMQQLVTDVRNAGATQPIMVSGLRYTNDLTGLLSHLPVDPAHQLAASFHVYSWNMCRTVDCYNQQILPVAHVIPVVTGEFGEGDCGSTFNNTYMNYADANGISYIAWAFDGYAMNSCSQNAFSLITDWNGTPSAYGQAVHDHLVSISPVTPPAPAPIPTPNPTPVPPAPTPTTPPTGCSTVRS